MNQSIATNWSILPVVSTNSTACWPAARRLATSTSTASCRASTPNWVRWSSPVPANGGSTEADLVAGLEMLADPEMRELAEAEVAGARERCRRSRPNCRSCCCPGRQRRAQRLSRNRAGTGGDESALFAGNLFRMYARYAERRRWQVEVISASVSDLGGYRKSSRASSAAASTRAEVRVGRPSRAARSGNRGAGPHPYVRLHGGRHAGGRSARGGADQPGRDPRRYLSRIRCGRAAHQQDRLGGTHHAPADGDRRRVPG
jgi:hypothetical protein